MRRFPGVVGVIGVLIGLSSCGEKAAEKAPAAVSAKPAAVKVAAAAEAEWAGDYAAPGTVRARSVATVSSRISGPVLEVRARQGDHVAAGQDLVLLDSKDLDVSVRRAEALRASAVAALPEFEASVAAAKSNLDLAEATFRRMAELFAKKSISNQEYDEADARVKQARANQQMVLARRAQLEASVARAGEDLSAAAIARGYARIAAPFAGVVTERHVEPGDLASPGAALLVIEKDGGFRLEAAVEESKLAGIRVGQRARVEMDAQDCAAPGTVDEIAPVGDAASRTWTVKVALSCAGLRGGMFGRAMFPGRARKALAVPAQAVVVRGQMQSVFVADSGVARLRLVSLGEANGGLVEVLSGVAAGEMVVLGPPPGLADGTPVEVSK